MSGYGDSWGSNIRRGQGDWHSQMQGGNQPDINADEGIGSNQRYGDTSQTYSSGYDQGYNQGYNQGIGQTQGSATQGGMSGMGAQGEGYGGGYGGQATQAYPQATSTGDMYGQQGPNAMQSSRMQGGHPGDEGLSGQHSTQGLRGQQQAAEGQHKQGRCPL